MALADVSAAAPRRRSLVELRYIRMRNTADDQMKRTTEFLKDTAVPALKRAGIGPLGFFASVIAPESPFILALATFPGGMAAMETAREKEAADAEYIRGRDAYNAGPGRSYERLDSWLLRCFETMPTVVPPPPLEKGSRIFELRTYESNNGTTLARKIKMFNEGEAAIFKRLGMHPVFFGETLIGAKMPSLTYMLSYEDLAARDRLWKAFGEDPEWRKLRSEPGYSDSEIVSNISNAILRPLPFSEIR